MNIIELKKPQKGFVQVKGKLSQMEQTDVKKDEE